jgi:hypothetical protein
LDLVLCYCYFEKEATKPPSHSVYSKQNMQGCVILFSRQLGTFRNACRQLENRKNRSMEEKKEFRKNERVSWRKPVRIERLTVTNIDSHFGNWIVTS